MRITLARGDFGFTYLVVAEDGRDINDQARHYVEWWTDGKYSVTGRCFNIGVTTGAALGRFLTGQDASRSGDPSESASGNGSIMRLAPVPIRYRHLFPNDIEALGRYVEESSLPTHASEQCLSACRYLALVLCGLIHGEERDRVLSPDWEPLAKMKAIKSLHPLVQAIAEGSFRTKQPPPSGDQAG